jgi:hypothetical protein
MEGKLEKDFKLAGDISYKGKEGLKMFIELGSWPVSDT